MLKMLAALARAEGYAACWVHPVVVPGDTEPLAAIVVWRTRPGAPTRFTWTTVRRVGQLLRLLADLGHDQLSLGDLQPLAVREQILHHLAQRGRQRRESEEPADRVVPLESAETLRPRPDREQRHQGGGVVPGGIGEHGLAAPVRRARRARCA